MAGFLGKWAGTKDIDVSEFSDDPPGTWVIRVKKCLTDGEMNDMLLAFAEDTVQTNVDDAGNLRIRPKLSMEQAVAFARDQLVSMIVSWNLTDDEDNLLPYSPSSALAESLRRLPREVTDRLEREVVTSNSASSAEVANFPAGGVIFDTSRQDDATDHREVLVGAELVATPGDQVRPDAAQ